MENESTKFWMPVFEDGEDVLGSETSLMASVGGAKTDKAEKKMVMPVVGDKMRFVVFPYGQMQLIEPRGHAQDGQDIIEVEVMATKKVRVLYE